MEEHNRRLDADEMNLRLNPQQLHICSTKVPYDGDLTENILKPNSERVEQSWN